MQASRRQAAGLGGALAANLHRREATGALEFFKMFSLVLQCGI